MSGVAGQFKSKSESISWKHSALNLWSIDWYSEPIKIACIVPACDLLASGWVSNAPLHPGGSIDYWSVLIRVYFAFNIAIITLSSAATAGLTHCIAHKGLRVYIVSLSAAIIVSRWTPPTLGWQIVLCFSAYSAVRTNAYHITWKVRLTAFLTCELQLQCYSGGCLLNYAKHRS